MPEKDYTSTTGVIEDIRTAVMEGNSWYFIRLEGEEFYYTFPASTYPLVVILNVGDEVEINHTAPEENAASGFLTGRSISLIR